jgi:hypothetical protein
MHRFLRNTVAIAGLIASWLAIGVLTAPIPLDAQVIPSGSTSQRRPVPRFFPTEQVAYMRTTLVFNMCTQTANACTVQAANASLPYNAIVLRISGIVMVAFNSTTSDSLSVGTTSANANELSTACNIHALGQIACTLVTTPANATGNTVAQSGQNGGLDVWVKWTAGTGNTATTGLVSLIIEYILPNDGLCGPVALGAAPAGC